MEPPGRSIEQPPAVPLPEVAIRYTGWLESDHDLKHIESNGATYEKRLGRACVQAARGQKAPAKQDVRAAKRKRKETHHQPMPDDIRMKLLDIYGALINHSKNQNAFLQERQQFHETSTNWLLYARNKVHSTEATTSTWLGLTNELTALCLLNRFEHPWMMALPSLKHHDRHGTYLSAGYDIALFTSLPGFEHGLSGSTHAALLQIKSSNFHLGNKPGEKQSVFMVNAREYFGYNPKADPSERFPVVSCLQRERNQEATIEDVKWLDSVTDKLTLDASIYAEKNPVTIPNDFACTA